MLIKAKDFSLKYGLSHRFVIWALQHKRLPGKCYYNIWHEGHRTSGWYVHEDEVTDEMLKEVLTIYRNKNSSQYSYNSPLRKAMRQLQEYNEIHNTHYSYGEAVVRGII